MMVSSRTRHLVALALAVAWTVLAMVQFADFSGGEPPLWLERTNLLLPPVALCMLALNFVLDRREREDDD